MSGNKMTDFETEIKTELDLDSGFQSGPIVVYPGDEDSDELTLQPEEADPPKSEENKEQSRVSVVLPGDSGVIADDISCLTDHVAEINLVDIKPEITGATCVRPHVTDLPLDLLFQQDDDGDTYVSISM